MSRRRAPSVILASASPRRKELLKTLGFRFRVLPSRVPEASSEKNPVRLVRQLALRKAQDVAKRARPGTFVLGADTVVVLKGSVLGKPRDARDAYRMLYRLSGTTHRVYTGVAWVAAATGRRAVGHAVSVVRMRKMRIDALLRVSRKHLDKAGAYAIQEKKDPVATVMKGSYENVVGLPLDVVQALLKKLASA